MDAMAVSFNDIHIGDSYSRPSLAELWGYAGFQALARGVVTPQGDNKIILFVTGEKQSSAEPYSDDLSGGLLHWEGPTDHFAEDRICSPSAIDEIHLFHRERHHSDFVYHGKLELVSCERLTGQPSKFVFRVAT